MNRLLRILTVLAGFAVAPAALAHGDRAIQEQIAFEQRIGATVPGDLAFTGADGARVELSALLDGKPAVLLLAWYSCPNLCPVALDALARGLEAVPFTAGKDFAIVAVSIDPEEGPAEARRIRSAIATRNGAGVRDWHFLTGERERIRALAESIGFRYAYDERRNEYAHPAGLVLLDTGRRVVRYLFGLRFAGRDLKLGLLDAGRGELGSPVDRLILRCHSFDPETGRYNLAVMNLLRLAGGGFALLLVSVVGVWWVRDTRMKGRGHGG